MAEIFSPNNNFNFDDDFLNNFKKPDPNKKKRKIQLISLVVFLSLATLSSIAVAIYFLLKNAKPNYGINLISDTLSIDKSELKRNESLSATITVKEEYTTTNEYSTPTTIDVRINNKKVDYTYNSTGGLSATLNIDASVINGDITITAEAEKVTHSVGDYMRVFVKDDSANLKITLNAGKTYLINAKNSDDKNLNCYLEGSKEPLDGIFTPSEDKDYNFVIKKEDETAINGYVTASAIEIMNNEETASSAFNLSSSYNKKIIAFYYLPNAQIFSSSDRILTTPIIHEGAKYIANCPKGLQDLLPSATIFDFNDGITKTTRLSIKNKDYVIADAFDTLYNFANKPYLFVAYFNNINESDKLAISSMLNYSVKDYAIGIKSVNDSRYIYIYDNLENDAYYSVDDFNHRNANIIDVDSAKELEVINNVFKNKGIKAAASYYLDDVKKPLKNFAFTRYYGDVKDGNIAIDNNFANQSLTFGSEVASKSIANTPVNTDDIYTYVIIEKTDSERVDSILSNITMPCFENKESGELLRRDLSFKTLAHAGNKYHIASANEEDNPYIKANEGTNDSFANKLALSFNNFAPSNNEHLEIYATKLSKLKSAPIAHSSITDSGMDHHWIIPGVPYACKITPEDNYHIDNIVVKINDNVIPSTYQNGVLSFTPSRNDVGDVEFIYATDENVFNINVLTFIADTSTSGPKVKLDKMTMKKITPEENVVTYEGTGFVFSNQNPTAVANNGSGSVVSLGLLKYELSSDKRSANFKFDPKPSEAAIYRNVDIWFYVEAINREISYVNGAKSVANATNISCLKGTTVSISGVQDLAIYDVSKGKPNLTQATAVATDGSGKTLTPKSVDVIDNKIVIAYEKLNETEEYASQYRINNFDDFFKYSQKSAKLQIDTEYCRLGADGFANLSSEGSEQKIEIFVKPGYIVKNLDEPYSFNATYFYGEGEHKSTYSTIVEVNIIDDARHLFITTKLLDIAKRLPTDAIFAFDASSLTLLNNCFMKSEVEMDISRNNYKFITSEGETDVYTFKNNKKTNVKLEIENGTTSYRFLTDKNEIITKMHDKIDSQLNTKSRFIIEDVVVSSDRKTLTFAITWNIINDFQELKKINAEAMAIDVKV